MGGIVYEDAHIVVEERPADRIVILRRHPTRPSASELMGSFREALNRHAAGHRGWGLVIDMRAAPGRSDDDFQQDTAGASAAAHRVFGCVVTLVGTAAGELQVRRVSREQGRDALVARDEPSAIALCLQSMSAAS